MEMSRLLDKNLWISCIVRSSILSFHERCLASQFSRTHLNQAVEVLNAQLSPQGLNDFPTSQILQYTDALAAKTAQSDME